MLILIIPRFQKPGILWNFITWALLLLIPPAVFVWMGTPIGHSYWFNFSWFLEVDKQLAQGVFPPRHLPGLLGGLGGIDFFFYGPLPFWFTSIVGFLFCPGCGADTILALSGGIAISLSGVTFFVMARRFVPAYSAKFGALIYMLLPYHLTIEWTVRQAFGELYAYVFIPLIVFGIDKTLREERAAPILSIAFAGLCATHLPSTLLAIHVYFVVFLYWAVMNRGAPKCILLAFLRLSVLSFLGAGLSCAFWLPAFVLINDVSINVLYSNFFNPVHSLWGPVMVASIDREAALIGISILSGLLVLRLISKVPKEYRPEGTVLWVFVPSITCIVLITKISAPLWENWIIYLAQLPARLLVFFDLSVGLSAAVSASAILSKKIYKSYMVTTVIMLVFINFLMNFLEWPRFSTTKDVSLISTPIGAPEYIPPDTLSAISQRTDETIPVLWPIASLISEISLQAREDSYGIRGYELTSRKAIVEPELGVNELLLPLPYWKHWEARSSSGQALNLSPDPSLGMTVVQADDQGEILGTIVLEIPWHWSERLGGWISLISAVLTLIMILTIYRSSSRARAWFEAGNATKKARHRL